MSGPMSTGVLGGSFNPVHRDHIAMALEARRRLRLDRVIFVTNASPAYKDTASTPYSDRRAMLEIATSPYPFFSISDLESDPAKHHYTFDTLSRLREILGPGERLFFLMGTDSLLYLDEWKRGLELASLANLAVIGRKGHLGREAKPAIQEFLARTRVDEGSPGFEGALRDPCGHCFMLSSSLHFISSRALREEISITPNGPLAQEYLEPQVREYALSRHLYDRRRG
ncbi:MAG: nicotinate (nicotinamide) nucleotide adenylyltransferase [Succinivibrio sp.]